MQRSLALNDGNHIHHAISTTTCEKHKAGHGDACWAIPNSKRSGYYYYGICGRRISSAGYNGRISPESMRSMAPSKKSTSGGKRSFNKNAR